jgi:hypothetical protein
MSFRAEQHRLEKEQYRQTKAYYASIRRPRLERITFTLALLASIAVSLRRFGIGITDYGHQGQWLTALYWVSFILFVGFDSIFAKAHHPVPAPFGAFNLSRIYEKFAMQERAWQLLLVLMLPLTVRLIVAVMAFNSAADRSPVIPSSL